MALFGRSGFTNIPVSCKTKDAAAMVIEIAERLATARFRCVLNHAIMADKLTRGFVAELRFNKILNSSEISTLTMEVGRYGLVGQPKYD